MIYTCLEAFIWEGDIIGAIDALVFGIMWGLVKMSTSILLGIGALLLSLAVSIIGGIVTGLYDVLKNTVLKRLPGFANGGITPGGPVVVGERGPEIVSLPKGSTLEKKEAMLVVELQWEVWLWLEKVALKWYIYQMVLE